MKRFFMSGHSLMDDPVGRFVARLAMSSRNPAAWDQQIITGSRIKFRNRNVGKDRRGNKTSRIPDVFQDAASRNAPFDTLIVTEAHNSVASVMRNNTVRNLRFMHERFIEANPAGRTFLYEPWESTQGVSDLASWIALERDNSVFWSCVATRINVSLDREGRSDRITPLPVGWGLAELMDAIISGKMPSFNSDASEAYGLIFEDGVHMNLIGRYFMALQVYVGVTGRPVAGLWHPAEVSKAHAAALQEFVQDFYEAHVRARTEPDLESCRAWIETEFCDTYNTYKGRGQRTCRAYFARTTLALDGFGNPNPLALPAPEADAEFWYQDLPER